MKKWSFFTIAWVVLAGFFCLGSIADAQVSPAGDGDFTWDVSIKGSNNGSGYLTFTELGDVFGRLLVVPGSSERKLDVVTFGYYDLTGFWSFDGKGQIVGFLESAPDSDARLDIFSFTGKIKGDKISLKARGTNGKLTLQGVPASTLADLTGFWTVRVNKVEGEKSETYIQKVLAIPILENDENINIYELYGYGADLCIFGMGMLSGSNRLGIMMEHYEMPDSEQTCADIDPAEAQGIGRGAIGLINQQKGQARLKGAEEGSGKNRVMMQLLQIEHFLF